MSLAVRITRILGKAGVCFILAAIPTVLLVEWLDVHGGMMGLLMGVCTIIPFRVWCEREIYG